ncbi:MAG: hypothetical protein UIH41_09750 [Treponemataceae bacterium]|jgi:uncharacterized integral membrane protein|nr:hypothetical protein [Treponemataceae bacterium]
MPGKLILFLIMIVIVTIFAGFNTTNVCNVSLVFHEFENVPVFVTVLFSFVIGIFVMLPFAFRKKQPKQNTSVSENQQKTAVKTESSDEKTVFKIRAGGGKTEKKDSKKQEN